MCLVPVLTNRETVLTALQAEDPDAKLSDPKHHSAERLATFLSTLSDQLPDPKCPDKKPVKPRKLLKRFLPWQQKSLQEDQALSKATSHTQPQQAGIFDLVQRTRKHPKFQQKYNFPSYEKGWVRTDRLRPPEPPIAPQLLALDCEMCVTADSSKELLQVALVDQHGKQVLQELVKPPSEVSDYRSQVTGITAADLEGVTVDRQAVATRIQQLLTPDTVLVGHSLHYDLQALKLDHQPIIDTAMLFSYEGLAEATPPLTHLAEQLLGKCLRGADGDAPHNSLEDARAALALVQRELDRAATQGPTPPLKPPEIRVDKGDQAKLLVHKLPTGATPAAVKFSFVAACRKAAGPSAVAAAAAVAAAQLDEAYLAKQQVLFVFKNPALATDAFSALPGTVFADSMGRHSKRMHLQGTSSQVVVRKMACHNGLAYGRDKAKDRGAKKKGKHNRAALHKTHRGKVAQQKTKGKHKKSKK
eukprot:GHRR01025237.1.p1 GENE.GHRR01025237.1~~GHRR01025237.1.p1  ORF type:complete len:473 (+),score=185.98 GHRR01025237.1:256-1674(+)